MRGDRLARDESEVATLQTAIFSKRKFSAGGLRKNRAGFREEHFPCIGELDTPPHAVEEGNVVATLQRRDRSAGGGLRHMKHLGRTGHMLAFANRNKDA